MSYIIHKLKNVALVAGLGLALCGWTAGAPAMSSPQSDSDITKGEVSNFDRYLDQHPEVTRQLKNNPSLVDRKEYLENHPELKEFLQNHPEAREELRENPSAFMKDERKFDQKTSPDITRTEAGNFDNYLDIHPAVAKQLRKNPSLVNNEDYVEKHPGLQEWMQNHPKARQELKENPKAFMRRERVFEKHEGPQNPRPAVARANMVRAGRRH